MRRLSHLPKFPPLEGGLKHYKCFQETRICIWVCLPIPFKHPCIPQLLKLPFSFFWWSHLLENILSSHSVNVLKAFNNDNIGITQDFQVLQRLVHVPVFLTLDRQSWYGSCCRRQRCRQRGLRRNLRSRSSPHSTWLSRGRKAYFRQGPRYDHGTYRRCDFPFWRLILAPVRRSIIHTNPFIHSRSVSSVGTGDVDQWIRRGSLGCHHSC